MGTFAGHFFPASFFFLFGVYYFFRSLHLKCTEFIRTSPRGILGGAVIGAFGSAFMIVGEYINSFDPTLPSHVDHFRANFCVFSASFFYLLHANRILTEAFWGLFPSISFLVMGTLMTMHAQRKCRFLFSPRHWSEGTGFSCSLSSSEFGAPHVP